MLKVDEISKYYGNKMAIEKVSFQAEKGQIIGLLGHNGCGKSTTMNIITNCLTPSAGNVWIDDVKVSEHPIESKRKIGYLPEIPPLYLDMTVEEQLRFACRLRKISSKESLKQIEQVCNYLNISGVRKRLIHNLSKGYRQRVGFAQALIGSPELLILDEPLVGLDPQQIIELRELIVKLKEEHTIILSSHILSEIAVTCDRIIVLSNGHLVANDTLRGLIRQASEKQEWILQADGPQGKLISIIEQIPLVNRCEIKKNLLSGAEEYHIYMKEGADIHRELFAGLSEAGCPIQMLKPVDVSLEDIFLRLTQDRRYENEKEAETKHVRNLS